MMAELAAAANGSEIVGVTPPGLRKPCHHQCAAVSTQVTLATLVAVRVGCLSGSAAVAKATAASNGR